MSEFKFIDKKIENGLADPTKKILLEIAHQLKRIADAQGGLE